MQTSIASKPLLENPIINVNTTLEQPLSPTKGKIFWGSTAEQFLPAARIIYVFQLIKNKYDLEKTLQSDVNWCIEQIAGGKIYDVIDSSQGGLRNSNSSTVKNCPALPWLAHFSTVKANLEEIQEYLNATKNIDFNPNPEQLAKKDEERVKRRSVQAKDLADCVAKREKLMQTVDSLNFNVFEAEDTLGREKVLPVIAFDIFQKHRIFSTTAIDENAFVAFLSEIRKGYVASNPYHNDLHATDVLQFCHLMLTKGGIAKLARLTPLDIAALLLAAIVHDFRHPGVSNIFLQNSVHDLAITYNDRSILESYHISEAYRVILNKKDCDLFANLTPCEKSIMRKRMISCVLATDMSLHGECLAKLQQKILMNNINNGKNAEKIINPKNEFESKQFILDVCLHLADIGNPCRNFDVYMKMVVRVLEEFGRQGDVEKSMKLPISFLCDRTTVNLSVSQIGYITGVLKPLLSKFVTIFPNLKMCMDNAEKCELEMRKIGH